MPDFLVLTEAGLAAAITAGIVYLLLGLPWRSTSSTRLSLGWTLGIGLGFYAGCRMLGLWPTWPPANDRDRFMMFVIPAALVVESVAACTFLPGWLIWVPRVILAAAVMPILLYGKGYYEDSASPGTQEWSLPMAINVTLILAGALLLVWFLLDRLQSRTSEKTVGAALCLTSLSAGAVVMYHGYLSGGQFGIPLAGALAGATAASFLTASPKSKPRFSGMGLLGLYSILILGRFLGELPTLTSLCLLMSPLVAWIPESPGLRQFGPRTRALLGLALVGVLLVPFMAEVVAGAISAEDP
jgi:hypothetical protein